jgi:glycosyltransferase involved in cell wall biosynthesis
VVDHLDTSDHRTGGNLGTWDPVNVVLGLVNVAKLIGKVVRGRGVVYLPLSQSRAALVRDTLFIQLSSRRGWKVAAHLRGSELHAVYDESQPLFRSWLGLALRRVDSLAVMGATIAGSLDGLVPRDRIAVVSNGTPDIGAGSGIHGTDVLFLSNLLRRKGVVEAVEAALLVLERQPNVTFRFVGEWESPELEDELRTLAESAGGQIEFLAQADHETKVALLHSAAVFLFPPVEPEGHPRVVLEALAAGLPIVTTDRGAICETVADGESGFVLPDPEPHELAKRILSLVEDEALRERMSAAARERYIALFTQEQADRVLSEWLESVAAASSPERETQRALQ